MAINGNNIGGAEVLILGLSFKENHRIVEIACLETNGLIPTKKIFHTLINP